MFLKIKNKVHFILKRAIILLFEFNPQAFPNAVLIIFFVGPKKMNPRLVGAGNEKALFQKCFLQVKE